MKTTRMIRRLCTISLVVLTTTAAFAQGTPPQENRAASASQHKQHTPDERIDHRIEMMKKHLAISDAQATQIASVLHSEQNTLVADRQRLQNAKPEDKMQARTQLQQDRLNVKSQVIQQLTPEQRAKAEVLRNARKDLMHKNHKRMHRRMMKH